MNRTLLNMVQSMMFFKNVKFIFLADAILCVVYLRNRSPTHVINNKTPYEMWHGHVPLVKHLRVFGSTYYALIPREKRTSWVQGFGSVFSLGNKIPQRIIVYMMR